MQPYTINNSLAIFLATDRVNNQIVNSKLWTFLDSKHFTIDRFSNLLWLRTFQKVDIINNNKLGVTTPNNVYSYQEYLKYSLYSHHVSVFLLGICKVRDFAFELRLCTLSNPKPFFFCTWVKKWGNELVKKIITCLDSTYKRPIHISRCTA